MSVAVPERSMASGRRAEMLPARRRYGLEWATMICGAALAVLTAADGTPAWQAARVLVVATLTAGAVIGEVRSWPHLARRCRGHRSGYRHLCRRSGSSRTW